MAIIGWRVLLVTGGAAAVLAGLAWWGMPPAPDEPTPPLLAAADDANAAPAAAPAPVPVSATVADDGLNEPIDLVPADCLLVWYGRPLPDVPPPDAGPTPLDALLNSLPQIAGDRLDRGAQLALRVFQTLGQMIRYDHAVAILGVEYKPHVPDPNEPEDPEDADKYDTENVQVAFIVDVDGDPRRFMRMLQTAIDEQTHSGFAELADRTAHGWEYHVLDDRRAPKWYTVSWGTIGDYFVLTLGDGTWPRIAEAAARARTPLSASTWLQSVRDERATDALIEVYAHGGRLREQVDPLSQDRVSEFLAAWGIAEMIETHWAVGLEGQALYSFAHFHMPDETFSRAFADPSYATEAIRRLIPEGARYAVYEVPAGPFVRRFITSLYVWPTPKIRRQAEQRWQRIQQEYDFDAERDILAHLGDAVILHNDPPHPLRLPVFFTTLIEIEDAPATVRESVARFCQAWDAELKRDAAERGIRDPMTLHQDRDGVWYLQVSFLKLMAWTVTDKYIIVSWSPTALRQYMRKAEGELGMP